MNLAAGLLVQTESMLNIFLHSIAGVAPKYGQKEAVVMLYVGESRVELETKKGGAKQSTSELCMHGPVIELTN